MPFIAYIIIAIPLTQKAGTNSNYLFPPTDSTLTLASLTSLLDSVSNWDRLHIFLDMPDSKYKDIMKEVSNTADRIKALCEWYIFNHPVPTWEHIAKSLYDIGEHEVLEVLRDQVDYLKGGCSYYFSLLWIVQEYPFNNYYYTHTVMLLHYSCGD